MEDTARVRHRTVIDISDTPKRSPENYGRTRGGAGIEYVWDVDAPGCAVIFFKTKEDAERFCRGSPDKYPLMSNAVTKLHYGELTLQADFVKRFHRRTITALLSILKEKLGIKVYESAADVSFSFPSYSGIAEGMPSMPSMGHPEMRGNGRYDCSAGFCLIINNTNFFADGLPDRAGSDVDRDSIRHLFSQLNFRVCVHNNLTGQEMQDEIRDTTQNLENCDCLVVFLLSHGGLGGVYGTDGEIVELKTITSAFHPTNCRSLRGKPKVFFVQTCPGNGNQEDVEWDSAIIRGLARQQTNDLELDSIQQTIPHDADFFLAYAIVDGYVPHRQRDDRRGTWFIQELVEKLNEHHQVEDLLSILKQMNAEVATEQALRREGWRKQMSALTSTLRKKIYW